MILKIDKLNDGEMYNIRGVSQISGTFDIYLNKEDTTELLHALRNELGSNA